MAQNKPSPQAINIYKELYPESFQALMQLAEAKAAFRAESSLMEAALQVCSDCESALTEQEKQTMQGHGLQLILGLKDLRAQEVGLLNSVAHNPAYSHEYAKQSDVTVRSYVQAHENAKALHDISTLDITEFLPARFYEAMPRIRDVAHQAIEEEMLPILQEASQAAGEPDRVVSLAEARRMRNTDAKGVTF